MDASESVLIRRGMVRSPRIEGGKGKRHGPGPSRDADSDGRVAAGTRMEERPTDGVAARHRRTQRRIGAFLAFEWIRSVPPGWP